MSERVEICRETRKQPNEECAVEWRDDQSRLLRVAGDGLQGGIEHDGGDAVRWGGREEQRDDDRAGHGIVLNEMS